MTYTTCACCGEPVALMVAAQRDVMRGDAIERITLCDDCDHELVELDDRFRDEDGIQHVWELRRCR